MALKIIIAVILLIFILLLMRVNVYISYEDDFKFKIRYLFIVFRMKAEQKGKAKTRKKQKEKTEFSISQVKAFLRLFDKLKDDIEKVLRKFKSHIRIDNIKISVVTGGDDPALTALTYGEACATIYPVLAVIQSNIRIKKHQVSVRAEFGGQSSAEFYCHISVRLCNLIATAFIGLIKALSIFIKIQRAKTAARNSKADTSDRQVQT